MLPVENLVLSPLSDGTYREQLIAYYLTEQDRQRVRAGNDIDLKNKTTVVELTPGTYGTGLLGKTTQCHYETVTYIKPCACHPGHTDIASCTCSEGKPVQYVLSVYVCEDVDGPSAPGGGSEGSEGSNGGSSGTGNTNPCGGSGASTQPQDPGTTLEGGCNNGTPTLINLEGGLSITDPCKRTQISINDANKILKDAEVKKKMDSVLKGKIGAPREWAVAIGQKPDGSYEVTPAVEGQQYEGNVPISQLTSSYAGDGHSHTTNPGVPSAGDLFGMLESIKNYTVADYRIRFVYGSAGGVPEIYALVLNNKAETLAFLDKYSRDDNYDILTHDFKGGSDLWKEADKMRIIYSYKPLMDSSGEYYNMKAVALAYILDSQNAGISLAKADANGNLKKINVSTEKGGPLGEKIIISECP